MYQLKDYVHAPFDNADFFKRIDNGLAMASNDLITANNINAANYRTPLVKVFLGFVAGVLRDTNTRRAQAGEAKVTQNFIIDALANEAEERVEVTDSQLAKAGRQLKTFLGYEGEIPLNGIAAGLSRIGDWHLSNLKNVSNKQGQRIFSDDLFNQVFTHALNGNGNAENATATGEIVV